MVLVGKVDTLLNIAKADSSASGKQLLSLLKMVEEAVNPYNTDKEKLVKLQNKLRKNAFALIRKQRYREAAATFLLCPTVSMIKSAQNVLAQQYRSPFLAHLVSRLMETRLHASTSNSAVASSTPFSQTTAASALNIDLAALNDPVADINNNSTNINNATLLIDRSSYVLGIFSAELIKKDILPGLLAAAENSISSTSGRSRFPFEGKPVSAMENDHTSVHFENIGYHGMLDYTAILMAILCSLWLQEEEVLMSTFDAVLPLLTKYLLLLASSSVPQSSTAANGATSSSSLKNINRFNVSQKASLTTTTSPFSSPPASTKNYSSPPSLLLSEKWKLILQIRHSFLHQYKVSQLHLIVTFLESTFHQNYLYSSHQMINFFYSFPFLMESSYFLPKSYSGKVLSFINEFYDFYHLPHEKLLFNNYFLSPTIAASSSSSSLPVEKESKSSKKPSVNTGKRLSNNSFFKYAKNYYNKSISQLNRSTINDVKFMRSNSIGGGSAKTAVNPFTVGLEGVTSPISSTGATTSEQVQQQPLPQSKFNFSSFGKTASNTTTTVPAIPSALESESLEGKASVSTEETKKTSAVASETTAGKSALDMFDMPPPPRRPVAPKPPAAAAAVDPFQSATGTGKSALDAFDFAPPMRNTSRGAKKEEPKTNVINNTAPRVPPPFSALDAFDNMGGRRPATTPSQAKPAESTAEKPAVANPVVSEEKKTVTERPLEAVAMKTDKPVVEKQITTTIPPTPSKKKEEDSSSSSSSIHAHPPLPHPFPSHPAGAAGAIPPSKTTGKVSTDSKPTAAHSVPPPSTTTAPHHRSFEQRIHSFYEKYNPTRIASIPSILEKYKGKEQDLIEKLKKQYNVPDI
jgi:hypothetical protein